MVFLIGISPAFYPSYLASAFLVASAHKKKQILNY